MAPHTGNHGGTPAVTIRNRSDALRAADPTHGARVYEARSWLAHLSLTVERVLIGSVFPCLSDGIGL